MAISRCLKIKRSYIFPTNRLGRRKAVLWWCSNDNVESPGIVPGQFLNKGLLKRRQLLPICTVVALVVSIELR